MSQKSKKTDTKPFRSLYSDCYVTPPNYIAELIVTKRNEYFNSGRCPERFWSQEKRKFSYKRMQWAINRLISIYSAESIISAVKQMKCVPKLNYHKSWDDQKMITENKSFCDTISKVHKSIKPKEMVETEQELKEVAKRFSKKKNVFGEL